MLAISRHMRHGTSAWPQSFSLADIVADRWCVGPGEPLTPRPLGDLVQSSSMVPFFPPLRADKTDRNGNELPAAEGDNVR